MKKIGTALAFMLMVLAAIATAQPTAPTHASVNGQGTPYLIGGADSAQCGLIFVVGGNMEIGTYQPVTILAADDRTVLPNTDASGVTRPTYVVNLKDDVANKFGAFKVLLRIHPQAGESVVYLAAKYWMDPSSYIVPFDYPVPLGPACQ